MASKKDYYGIIKRIARMLGYLYNPGIATTGNQPESVSHMRLNTPEPVYALTFLFRAGDTYNASTQVLMDFRTEQSGYFYSGTWAGIAACYVDGVSVNYAGFFSACAGGSNWRRVYVQMSLSNIKKIIFYTVYNYSGSYKCDMKDLRVFRSALTATEREDALNGNPPAEKLISHFPFTGSADDVLSKSTLSLYRGVTYYEYI